MIDVLLRTCVIKSNMILQGKEHEASFAVSGRSHW